MDKNERGEGRRQTRRCALTKQTKPESELVRYVANEEGQVFVDANAKAPGRGVWISADKETLEKAIKANSFSNSLKRKCAPNLDLIEQTQSALLQKCLNMLGFAKRSGDIILGFDTIIDSIKNKPPAFIIEASDSAKDGREKIFNLARAKWGDVKIIGCFDSQNLSRIFGRDNVIHAVFAKGVFANNWQKEIERLAGFIEIIPNEWVNEKAKSLSKHEGGDKKGQETE